MNRATILGSGNAFNTDGRAHACYLIEIAADEHSANDAPVSRTTILLDVGATSLYRLQQQRVDLNQIDAILLTHFHGDHFAGLPFVLLEMALVLRRARRLTIMGPPGVADKCAAIVNLCYPGFTFDFEISYVELETHREPYTFGAATIVPYAITHRPESTGYRIIAPNGRSFAFSGDALFDHNLCALVDGVDLALVELTMAEQWEPPVAHVALSEVRARRSELKAARLVFTHITDQLARTVVAEGLGEAASDGLVLTF